MSHFKVPSRHRQHAKSMRKEMTSAELRFWNAVRAHRLMDIGFRRQMPIGGYIVDFTCPEHKLIIDVDGASHSYDQTMARDALRNQRLGALGWQTVRFTNDEVLHHLDDVCTHILRIIGIENVE